MHTSLYQQHYKLSFDQPFYHLKRLVSHTTTITMKSLFYTCGITIVNYEIKILFKMIPKCKVSVNGNFMKSKSSHEIFSLCYKTKIFGLVGTEKKSHTKVG